MTECGSSRVAPCQLYVWRLAALTEEEAADLAFVGLQPRPESETPLVWWVNTPDPANVDGLAEGAPHSNPCHPLPSSHDLMPAVLVDAEQRALRPPLACRGWGTGSFGQSRNGEDSDGNAP